jgi:hypothetical protein
VIPNFGPPFHFDIDLVVGDLGEAEPPVKPQRRIEFFHHDADAAAASGGLLQRPQDRAAGTLSAPRRHQRDVDDMELRLPRFEIEPPGRLAAQRDQLEPASGNVSTVVVALRLELTCQEGLLLLPLQGIAASSCSRVEA